MLYRSARITRRACERTAYSTPGHTVRNSQFLCAASCLRTNEKVSASLLGGVLSLVETRARTSDHPRSKAIRPSVGERSDTPSQIHVETLAHLALWPFVRVPDWGWLDRLVPISFCFGPSVAWAMMTIPPIDKVSVEQRVGSYRQSTFLPSTGIGPLEIVGLWRRRGQN